MYTLSGSFIVRDADGSPVSSADTEYVRWLAAGNVPTGGTPADLLNFAKALKIPALSEACQSAITAGFTSSALGTLYEYGSSLIDQANIRDAAQNAGALWCAAAGAWTYTSHTAEQAAQVYADFVAMKNAAQKKYADLLTRVNADTTTTPDAVNAIVWA